MGVWYQISSINIDNCSRHGMLDRIGSRILKGLSQSSRRKIDKIAHFIEHVSPKSMESARIMFPGRFYFFTKKKTGRSVSGEGWRRLYVGTVKKKNHTPLL